MYHGKAEILPSPYRAGRPYLKEGKMAAKRSVIALAIFRSGPGERQGQRDRSRLTRQCWPSTCFDGPGLWLTFYLCAGPAELNSAGERLASLGAR